VAEVEKVVELSELDKFKAFADLHDYEFAKENFSKPSDEVAEILLASKNAEIEALKIELSEVKKPEVEKGVEFSEKPKEKAGLASLFAKK
jgi:hypothetical protein